MSSRNLWTVYIGENPDRSFHSKIEAADFVRKLRTEGVDARLREGKAGNFVPVYGT